MTELTIKEWIEIIDRDIEHNTKIQMLVISKMGSAFVILGLLMWFIYSNFFTNKTDLNIIILALSIIFIFFQFILPVVIIFSYRVEKDIKHRRECNYTLLEQEPILEKDVFNVVIIIFFIITIINVFLLKFIQGYTFYFTTSVLINITFGLIIWTLILFDASILNYNDYLVNLKYEILEGNLSDIESIKRKYLAIGHLKQKNEIKPEK